MDVLRNGENVTDYLTGKFGDQRLTKIGALLFKNICNKLFGGLEKFKGYFQGWLLVQEDSFS